jgi:hypothetical protein
MKLNLQNFFLGANNPSEYISGSKLQIFDLHLGNKRLNCSKKFSYIINIFFLHTGGCSLGDGRAKAVLARDAGSVVH